MIELPINVTYEAPGDGILSELAAVTRFASEGTLAVAEGRLAPMGYTTQSALEAPSGRLIPDNPFVNQRVKKGISQGRPERVAAFQTPLRLKQNVRDPVAFSADPALRESRFDRVSSTRAGEPFSVSQADRIAGEKGLVFSRPDRIDERMLARAMRSTDFAEEADRKVAARTRPPGYSVSPLRRSYSTLDMFLDARANRAMTKAIRAVGETDLTGVRALEFVRDQPGVRGANVDLADTTKQGGELLRADVQVTDDVKGKKVKSLRNLKAVGKWLPVIGTGLDILEIRREIKSGDTMGTVAAVIDAGIGASPVGILNDIVAVTTRHDGIADAILDRKEE